MKKSILLLLALLLFVVALTSCATTVTVEIERPAELDLNGAKSVGMLPFQAKPSSSTGGSRDSIIVLMDFFGLRDLFYDQDDEDRQQLADLLSRKLQENLTSSQYLELVDSRAVQNAVASGLRAPCDVYLTGVISSFETSIKSKVRTRKVNGVNRNVTYYYRVLNAEVMYQVIDAMTNRVVSLKTVPIELESYEVEAKSSVESAYSLARSDFEKIADTILRQIQPYTIQKTLTLLSDPNKDPDMKYADEVVKSGEIEYAETLFEDIYVRLGYMEAGYNAAILLEAMGDLEGARDLMQEVYDIYKSSDASRALADIIAEIDSAKRLEYQNEIRK
ncbi:MAG: hypothetical protein K5930_04640 [Treponemataceae bacterium]|nr:hypothetical protein [Treponemataceae bacterium]